MAAVITTIKVEPLQSKRTTEIDFGNFGIYPHELNFFALARAISDAPDNFRYAPSFLTPDGKYVQQGDMKTHLLNEYIMLFQNYEDVVKKIYQIKKAIIYDKDLFVIYQLQAQHYGVNNTLRPVKLFQTNP